MPAQKSLSSSNSQSFPFAAVVGKSTEKLALMLLAVDKNLRGVLLSSPSGTAKSALTRAAQAIFQNQTDDKESKTPFVALPLGVTLDRLLGGLDFERALLTGKSHYAKGLLAQAHGGVLFVDDINLLEINLSDQIAAALDSQTLQIERDGLSMATGADFVLLGVGDFEENGVSSLLRERVALIVEVDNQNAIDERTEIVSRVVAYQERPQEFINRYDDETRAIQKNIADAKMRLPQVKISVEDLRSLSAVSMSLGVEGNQADIFALRVAKANAALAGRKVVNEADIITAIQLVLLPRATRIPTRDEVEELANQEQSKNDKPEGEQTLEQQSRNREQHPESDHPEDKLEGNSQELEVGQKNNHQVRKFAVGAIEDLIVNAIDSPLPNEAIQAPMANRKSLNNISSGKRSANSGANRGRYVRDSAKKNKYGKIAVAATLRAAAPFQLFRKAKGKLDTQAVKITADDLRYKRFKKKSAMLFIFAVDASGSMALNRMAQAKGAMTRLLQEAYIHRDKVALISFRNHAATVLLPPTRSVELAKRTIDAIPTGGATPVAAALLEALKVAKHARSQEISQAMLVMFTDGRANVGLHVEENLEGVAQRESIKEELRQLGVALKLAGITSLVLDTKPKFIAGGEARELSQTLGAHYCYLPRADDKTIYESVSNRAKPIRNL